MAQNVVELNQDIVIKKEGWWSKLGILLPNSCLMICMGYDTRMSHLTFELGLGALLYDMLSEEVKKVTCLPHIDPLLLAFATIFCYDTYLVEHEEIVQTSPNDLFMFWKNSDDKIVKVVNVWYVFAFMLWLLVNMGTLVLIWCIEHHLGDLDYMIDTKIR